MCDKQGYYRFFRFDQISPELVSSSAYLEPGQLLILRTILLALVTAILVWTYLYFESWGWYFIFISDWNIMIGWLYQFMACFYTLPKLRENEPRLIAYSIGRQITYVLFEIAFPLCLTVVVLYWVFIFPKEDNSSAWKLLVNILLHGVNLLWLSIDFYFNRIRFVPQHVIFYLFIILAYMITNLIGTSYRTVYDDLTWRNTYSAILVVGAVILSLICFFVGYLLTNHLFCCKKFRERVVMPQNTDDDYNNTMEMEVIPSEME